VETPIGDDLSSGVYLPTPGEPSQQGDLHVFIVDNERNPIGVVNADQNQMPNWVVPGYTVQDGNAHITHAVRTSEFDDSGYRIDAEPPTGMVWVRNQEGKITHAVETPIGDDLSSGVYLPTPGEPSQQGDLHVFIVDRDGDPIGLVNADQNQMPNGVVPGYTVQDGNAHITHAVVTPGLDDSVNPMGSGLPDGMVWVDGDKGIIGAVQVPGGAGSPFSVSIEGETYHFQSQNGEWSQTSYDDAMAVLGGANLSDFPANIGGADAPSGTPAQPTSNEGAENPAPINEAPSATETATSAAAAAAYGGIALGAVGQAVTQAGNIGKLAELLHSIESLRAPDQSQANNANGSSTEKLLERGINTLKAGVESQQTTAATKATLAAIGAGGAGASTAAVGVPASAAGIIGTARDVINKTARLNEMQKLRETVTEKLGLLASDKDNEENPTPPGDASSGNETMTPDNASANSGDQPKLEDLKFKVTGLLDEKGFRRTAGRIAGGLNTVLHAATIASVPLGGFAPINILNKGVDAVKTFANNVRAERYLKEDGSTISSGESTKSWGGALTSLGKKWWKKEIKNNNDNEPGYKQAGRLVAKPVQLVGRLAVGLYKATTDTIVDAALAIPSAIEVLGRNGTDTVARLRGKSTEKFKDPIVCNTIKKGLKNVFDFGGGVSWFAEKLFGTFDQTKVRAFKEADIQHAFLDAYNSDGATEDQKKAIVEVFKALYSTSLNGLVDDDVKKLLSGAEINIDGKQNKLLDVLKLRVGRADIGILGNTNKAGQ
jgi:hypothetical protein